MESGRLGHGQQQAAAAEEGRKEGGGSLPLSLPRSLPHSPFIAPISFDLTDRPKTDMDARAERRVSEVGLLPSPG